MENSALSLTRKSDKVAIVGFCQPHRAWIPYDDPAMEIWGLNRGYIFMERADRWFEMHGPAIHEWQQRRPGQHLQYLRDFAGPVYMHQARPDIIPNSVDYPLGEVAADLGINIARFNETDVLGEITAAPYLTSSVNQEIALAIHMEYREIWLFGIDLNTRSEYAWQKPGVEHMLGIAAGRGIKVYLPEHCPLLAGPIYGRGFLSPKGEQLSPDQWMERITSLQADKTELEARINKLAGGKEQLIWIQTQMVPGPDHEIMDQRRQQMEQAANQLQGQLLQNIGALQETLYWAHQTPFGQDPTEALGQLVAAAEAGQGRVVDQTAAIAGLAAEHLVTNGYMPSEGPGPGDIESLLADVPVAASGIAVG